MKSMSVQMVPVLFDWPTELKPVILNEFEPWTTSMLFRINFWFPVPFGPNSSLMTASGWPEFPMGFWEPQALSGNVAKHPAACACWVTWELNMLDRIERTIINVVRFICLVFSKNPRLESTYKSSDRLKPLELKPMSVRRWTTSFYTLQGRLALRLSQSLSVFL